MLAEILVKDVSFAACWNPGAYYMPSNITLPAHSSNQMILTFLFDLTKHLSLLMNSNSRSVHTFASQFGLEMPFRIFPLKPLL